MSGPNEQLMASGLRIGKHVEGGKKAIVGLEEALSHGATALQMFAGSPQRYWPTASIPPETLAEFRERGSALYKMIHSVYILNACENPEERNYRMTYHSLVKQLAWAEKAGCESLVFHPGSAKENPRDDAIGWLIECVNQVMADYEGPVKLLLENKAVKGEKVTGDEGCGRGITGNIHELANIVRLIDNDRVGITIDTTHAFASGYSVPAMIEAMEDPAVWPFIDVVHFNTPDPGVRQGSGKDRHSSTFEDGVFSMKLVCDLFHALKEKVLILEGNPDFADALSWFLRWELEARDNEESTLPPENPNSLDPTGATETLS